MAKRTRERLVKERQALKREKKEAAAAARAAKALDPTDTTGGAEGLEEDAREQDAGSVPSRDQLREEAGPRDEDGRPTDRAV